MGKVEGLSARSLLTKALKHVRQGCMPADKKKKTQKIAIDKATFDKSADIHMIMHGYKEEFSNIRSLGKLGGSPSSTHQPRYFYYGKKPFVRSVKDQLEIAKEVMSFPFWKQWYEKDLAITRNISGPIDDVCNTHSVDSSTIRHMLLYSDKHIPDRKTRSTSSSVTPLKRSAVSFTTPVMKKKAPPVVAAAPSSVHSPSSSQSALPDKFYLDSLKQTTMEDLAKLEIESRELSPPTARRWAMKNIETERAIRMEQQHFKPSTDKLLVDWLKDAERHSAGEQLPRQLLEIHPDNRQRWFKDSALSTIRHIIFSYNIPTTRFGSLLCSFAVLLLGRTLKMDEFMDKRSLNRRLMRLSVFDWHRSTNCFENYISALTEHGFKRYWYSVTDDSKHFKLDRHALMISFQEEATESPSHKVLTVSAAASKGSKGNTELNVNKIKASLSSKIIVCYGGNASDHANDARKESRDTFTQLLADDRLEHGLVPKPILICDLFHADNLAVTHASMAAFGDTERNNHRQRHHRQLLQSLYDLFTLDRLKHQALMDKLMENSSGKITIKTMRERVQRWLANQRNSSWVVDTLQELSDDGTPVLIKWAHSCGDYSTSENTKVIAKDVVEMLFMPEILVALNFETEMGLYFEITSRFHGQPGILSDRPGFRAMELHTLWFEYVCPWWESAIAEPHVKHFKKTFECINAIDDADLKVMKIEQVKTGIKAGYNQIIKLSDILLSVPVLFAALTDPNKGPGLARALVKVMMQKDDLTWMEYNFDRSWGMWTDNNDTDKQMLSLLQKDQENVWHYFQQFGMGISCVEPELKKLTLFNVEEPPRNSLLYFKKEYPILFECLSAKFALLPSSTRIVEQKHGQLRHSLKPKAGLDFTDSQQQYLTNVEYQYREARRRSERKRKAEKQAISKSKKMSSGVTSVKHDDSKQLQRQTGLDLLKQERLYDPEIIQSYPETVQKQAEVKNTSKKGTTSRDRILMKERVQDAEETKVRSRKKFPSIEELKTKASNTQVDNDRIWNHIDEGRAEMQEDIDTLRRAGFWRTIPAKDLKEQVQKVFPSLWKDEYQNATKKKLLEIIIPHLRDMETELQARDDFYSTVSDYMKWDKCTYLQERKKLAKESFESKRNVFKSCGTTIADRERYQHSNMNMDEEDSDSEEEN